MNEIAKETPKVIETTKPKKTALLIAELVMIADTLASEYAANILREAAERLYDTDAIAEFYRKEAESRPPRLVITKLEKKGAM